MRNSTDRFPVGVVTPESTAAARAEGPEASEIAGLIGAAKDLYRRGWMDGTAGNLSARLLGRDDLVLVTATSCRKGELTPADFVVVRTASGEAVSSTAPRPSAETCIHTALYRLDGGCGAVVHAHPPWSAAVASLAEGDEVRFTDFEIIKGLGVADPRSVAVPVLANWSDVGRIAADIERRFTGRSELPPVLLIANHGATAWGATLDVARNRLESLEALCQLYVLTKGVRIP